MRRGLHGLHAMSMVWPEHAVDLAEAARLFERAGKPTSRSSLSRFVAKHSFPYAEGPKGAKLVDAKALFEAYTTNFTRQVMAGETGAAPQTYTPAHPRAAQLPAGDPPDPAADPKFRLAELRAAEAALDMAERLNETVPAAEVAAAMGEAVASLRAAYAEARADAVSRLLQLFSRPESDARLIRDELKRFEREGQEKFAAAFAAFLTPDGQTHDAAREKLSRAAKIAEALDAEPQS